MTETFASEEVHDEGSETASPLIDRLELPVPDGVTRFDGEITSPAGFCACGVHCGIKRKRLDLSLLVSDRPASVAGLFTTNRVKAPCVPWCQDVVKRGTARAVVINSGNANACTGARGRSDNQQMAQEVAAQLDLKPEEVFVSSTGVIGAFLPMTKISKGIEDAVQALGTVECAEGGAQAARGILTTDTHPKVIAVRLELSGKTVTLAGMAKGSGMIGPNMATTLGFITTDAAIAPELLQTLLHEAIGRSFNEITVDGDTSTNDTVLALANGASGVTVDESNRDLFGAALTYVAQRLALEVLADGEGVTRVMRVWVEGAKDDADAREVARTVANSLLIKTAIHGPEPNWGRVMMAIGRSNAEIDADTIDVWFGDVHAVSRGMGALEDLDPILREMSRDQIELRIGLGIGSGEATYWTSDLSAEYVRINGSYMT